MPMTFKQYLLKNKKRTQHQVYGVGGWWGWGYYNGYNIPQNDQSVGDVTGGNISGGIEGEEKNIPNLPADETPKNINNDYTKQTNYNDIKSSDLENSVPEDPNKQGIIRFVKGAKLVYKREADDGTFEELWIYNIGDFTRDEFEIRKDILAGTDIPMNKTTSDDGSQSYSIWTSGNAQMIKITGLPN